MKIIKSFRKSISVKLDRDGELIVKAPSLYCRDLKGYKCNEGGVEKVNLLF